MTTLQGRTWIVGAALLAAIAAGCNQSISQSEAVAAAPAADDARTPEGSAAGDESPVGGPTTPGSAPAVPKGDGVTDPIPPAGQEPPAEPQPIVAAAPPVTLTVVDKDGFQQAIDGFKGKVVLVDFWATWCAPCIRQLPHNLELAKKHAGDGLVIVTVSFDDPQDKEAVTTFLAAKEASAENITHLLSSYGGEQSIDVYEIDNGGIPNYWVYDRDGKQAHRFSPNDPTGSFKPEMIDQAIEKLLAAKPGDEGKSETETKKAKTSANDADAKKKDAPAQDAGKAVGEKDASAPTAPK